MVDLHICCCKRRKMACSGNHKPSKQVRAKLDSFVVALTKKGIKLLALDFDKTIIDIHSGGMWNEGVDKLASHVRPCMRDLMDVASHKGLFVAIVTFHRQEWIIKEVLLKVLSKKYKTTFSIAELGGILSIVNEAHLDIDGKDKVYERESMVFINKRAVYQEYDRVANKIYIQANTIDFMQKQRTSSVGASEPCNAAVSTSATSPSTVVRVFMPELNGKQAHIEAVIAAIHRDHNVTLKKNEIILMDDDINNVRIASCHGHYAFQVQQNVDYNSFESFETMLLL